MEIGNKFGSWRVPPGGVKFNQKANGGSEALQRMCKKVSQFINQTVIMRVMCFQFMFAEKHILLN